MRGVIAKASGATNELNETKLGMAARQSGSLILLVGETGPLYNGRRKEAYKAKAKAHGRDEERGREVRCRGREKHSALKNNSILSLPLWVVALEVASSYSFVQISLDFGGCVLRSQTILSQPQPSLSLTSPRKRQSPPHGAFPISSDLAVPLLWE